MKETYGDCKAGSHAVRGSWGVGPMAMTLGIMASLAQLTPKTSVSAFRFFVAASRMENTVSPSQLMQSSASFASKNSTPSCFARRGMYWMIANRTLHCLSSASCMMAGRRCSDRGLIPITVNGQSMGRDRAALYTPLFTSSSLEMMCNRTSGKSSLSICWNIGSRCSTVLRHR